MIEHVKQDVLANIIYLYISKVINIICVQRKTNVSTLVLGHLQRDNLNS